MERRAFKRIPVHLQARLFFGNLVYTGVVTNLSEKGMFISTKMTFPGESVLVTSILINRHTLKLPIKIKRTVKSNNNNVIPGNGGVGVEILEPTDSYKKFIDSCKSSTSASVNS